MQNRHLSAMKIVRIIQLFTSSYPIIITGQDYSIYVALLQTAVNALYTYLYWSQCSTIYSALSDCSTISWTTVIMIHSRSHITDHEELSFLAINIYRKQQWIQGVLVFTENPFKNAHRIKLMSVWTGDPLLLANAERRVQRVAKD